MPATPKTPASLHPSDETFATEITGLPPAFLRTPAGSEFYFDTVKAANAARAKDVAEIAAIRAAADKDFPQLHAARDKAKADAEAAFLAFTRAQRAFGAAEMAVSMRSTQDAAHIGRIEARLRASAPAAIQEAREAVLRLLDETRTFRVSTHVVTGDVDWLTRRKQPDRVFSNRGSLHARLDALRMALETLDAMKIGPRIDVAEDCRLLLASIPAVESVLRADDGSVYAAPDDVVPAPV